MAKDGAPKKPAPGKADVPPRARVRAKPIKKGKGGSTGPKGITDAQIVAALIKNAGIVAHAAASLGIDRKGLEDRIGKSDVLKAAKVERKAVLIDQVEALYIQQMLDKKTKPEARRNFLDTFAKDRGYGQPLRLAGPTGGPLIDFEQLLAGLSDEEVAVVQSLRRRAPSPT